MKLDCQKHKCSNFRLPLVSVGFQIGILSILADLLTEALSALPRPFRRMLASVPNPVLGLPPEERKEDINICNRIACYRRIRHGNGHANSTRLTALLQISQQPLQPKRSQNNNNFVDLPTLVKQLCIHLRETAKSNKTKSQQVKRVWVSSVLDFCTWKFESFAKSWGWVHEEGNARSL